MQFLHPEGTGVRILSLDGGDARCYSQLLILEELMHRLEYDHGRSVRPCEFFHSITGVGAGGVIAILLGVLGMTVSEATETFVGICEKVFASDPKEDGIRAEMLALAIKAVLNKLDIPHTTRLAGDIDRSAGCNVSICYSSTAITGCRMFRNYKSRQSSYNPTIVEAARACWATPGLFSSIFIGTPPQQEEVISAVNGFNNPAVQAAQDAREFYGAARAVSVFLSVGSGKDGPISIHSDGFLHNTVQQTEITEEHIDRDFGPLGIYYRLCPEFTIPNESSAIHANQIGSIISYTRAYMERVAVTRVMEAFLGASMRTSNVDLTLKGDSAGSSLKQDRYTKRLSHEERSLLSDLGIKGTEYGPPLQGCMKGTRTAILNNIHDWAADLDAPNILWLKGHPGVGKSAIAAEVVDQLATLGRLGSSFFFQRQKAAELTPHALWRTVSYNLARRHPLVRKAVLLKLEEEVISPGTPNLEGLFLHFIREPLMGSTGIPNSRLPIIVIDALDECGGLEGQQSVYRKGLMKTLRNWSELPTKFKLIVTSRGENDIERLFSTTRNHLIEILAGDTVDAQSSEDIKMFLIEELQSIAAQYHLSLPQTNWPDAQIIDLLVIRAAGLFIWAQTVTRFISLGQPKRRLNQVLEGKAKGSIDSLYDQILGTFFSSEEDMQDFHTVVGAIILMKAPLTLTSLAHLLSMDESDVEHICIRLQSVLEYHNHLHFYHQSFVDFLLDHDRCTLGFAIEPDRENRHLALACLRVLNNELRFNLCRVESSHFRNVDIPDLTSRAEKFIPPHLLYSSLWWTRHLSETAFDTEIFDRVQCFMHEQFLFWLEVLSISQQMNLGSQTLSSLINWIQPHDDRGTIDLAKDMQKFVVTFAAAISQSVTHIYISALPFSPPVSAVRNHYKPKYPRTLMIQSGGLTHWPALLHVLMGHTDEVTSAVISSDGKRIFSGSRDNTIRIWDAETGDVVVVPLKGHSDRIKSTSFSLDGKRVVSGSDDRTIRVWDIETGETITGPLEGHTKEIISVAISPDGKRIVSGSKDTTVRVWDAETGAIITSPLKSHTSWVSSVAFSPDGRRIVSGSWDETIRVWDAETGAVITGPLKIHDGVVNSVAFSPDGKFIASGSSDKTIQVYDTEIGAVATGSLKGHTDEIFSIAFSRDGKRIVSGSNDTTIRVWDTRTGAVVIGPLKGHNNRVTSIAFSLDGRRIISGSWDKTIQVWDVETAAIVSGPLDGHIDGVTSVAISPDGKHIASGSWDRTIRVWSAEAGAAVTGPLEGHSDWIKSVAFSPDGKRIVSGSSDETIRVWDVNTGAILTGPLEDTSSLVNSVNSVAFSPDGERIISGSEDGKIRLWDVKTGVILLVFLDGHSREVTSVIFSPDGKRIASGSKDKTIRVWDVDTGATVAGPLEDHSDWVKSVAFSPDGERIVSGSNDKTIRVWDIKAGTVLIGPLLGHNGAIRSVAFSPDGKWIVSGSSDTIVRVWDVETGALVTGPLEGHNSDVNSVAFSPDGRHIISGSSDGVIRQWNCLPYETQDSSPCPPEFSPSSRMVDGWVLGPKSELLFWVPPMLRPGLCWPTNTLVITRDIVTRLQLKNFVSGNAWGLCKA